MEYETLRGKIHYTSDKPGREDQERGREWFTITKNGDGSRTLRALCQIDDPPAVWRDVVQTVGPDNLPTDSFVRLCVGGEFVGSSWYRFGENFIECEGFTAAEGRISQRFDTQGRAIYFDPHPIQGDAWLFYMYDRSQGPGMQSFDDLFMSSHDHRGATGPMLVPHGPGLLLGYVGRERITVGAGTFDALHFHWGDRTDPGDTENKHRKHPPYEVWVTDDDDFIVLKAFVSGYMKTRYELVELEIR